MAGAVAIETMVDAAVMHSLCVIEPMRGRGIGAALVGAARKAAHTRGARHLYGLGGDGASYVARFGFKPVAPAEMLEDIPGTFIADYFGSHPEAFARLVTMRLDISRDGVIER
jgi:N-acetylglutamate synthase-like GNAT family acetyltransferase